MQHKHTVPKVVKPCSVQLRRMLSVTLLFVTRNLLVPEIVCEHGGQGITPSSLPLSAVRSGVGAEEWWWGCGLRMDNKYAVYDLAWVRKPLVEHE